MEQMRAIFNRAMLTVVLLGTAAAAAQADVAIVLRRSFVEDYADRATVTTAYKVAFSHPRPKAASQDGDIHCSGTADSMGLACVAEVIHAALSPKAVTRMHAAAGQDPIPVVGVWRIWPEHASGGIDFVQGGPIDPITDTNPPHVAEIHPLVDVDGIDVRNTFVPVTGYSYKDPTTAFGKFEALPCEIEAGPETITLTTQQIGYNYVKFRLKSLDSAAHELADHNHSIYATVVGTQEDEPIVAKVRCIFIDGTKPAEVLAHLHAGQTFGVIGVPRVDLAVVKYRAEHGHDSPELLHRTLPYEMIIVGVTQ